jgi:hypothetical protein
MNTISTIFIICILLLILSCFIIRMNQSEWFAYPFSSLQSMTQRRYGKNPCVSGCILQNRRGVFVDRECESLCRNWYTPVNVKNTNYGYEISSSSQYSPKGKIEYDQALNQTVQSNQSAMQFSTTNPLGLFNNTN